VTDLWIFARFYRNPSTIRRQRLVSKYVDSSEYLIEEMDETPVCLTFGFELELVVGSQTVLAAAKSFGRSKISPPTIDREVYSYFAKRFTDGGCQAEAYLPTSTRSCPDYSKWNFTNDSSIMDDTSSMEGSPEPQCRVGMELVSPVFRVRDEWENTTRNALMILNQTDIRVNSTTGFHVHVGMEGRDFNMAEVKRLAQYVVIFECEPFSL
jgi:Putative amidoligase enzyme